MAKLIRVAEIRVDVQAKREARRGRDGKTPLPPFSMTIGSRARAIGRSKVGLERSGLVGAEVIGVLERALADTGDLLPDAAEAFEPLADMIKRYDEMLARAT